MEHATFSKMREIIGFHNGDSIMAPGTNLRKPGKPYWRGRNSTVDLLIKVACFVIKVINSFNIKAADLR